MQLNIHNLAYLAPFCWRYFLTNHLDICSLVLLLNQNNEVSNSTICPTISIGIKSFIRPKERWVIDQPVWGYKFMAQPNNPLPKVNLIISSSVDVRGQQLLSWELISFQSNLWNDKVFMELSADPSRVFILAVSSHRPILVTSHLKTVSAEIPLISPHGWFGISESVWWHNYLCKFLAYWLEFLWIYLGKTYSKYSTFTPQCQ